MPETAGTMSPQRTIAHYRITVKLGEGGRGGVWRPIDTKLNRDVAIKIRESFAGDPDRLTRFAREAQVLAWLNHPTSRRSTVWKSARWCQICAVEETLCVSP